MARIRSRFISKAEDLSAELVEAIVKAIREEEQTDGPVIFEIQIGITDSIEVVAVWDRWSDLAADTRTRIVLEAYKQASQDSRDIAGPDRISSVLPVSVDQALEMGVLPYAVRCGVRKGDTHYEIIQDLIRSQGAIKTGGEMELRLPTIRLAREAREWLRDATKQLVPEVHWQISEQVGRIIDY